MKGIDYAWANPKPSTSCLISNGVGFIMRYFSNDPSKDLTQQELNNALAAGIAVGVVWETTASRMLSGYSGGLADAQTAGARASNLGMVGIPIYFACDWDANESEQQSINAYLDGAASILGRYRVGMYGGYWPITRAFNAGKITYGWQTYAWSGGNWDSRAQLRQTQNGVTVCGTSSDWDQSMMADFGQWPRPIGPQPEPPEEAVLVTSAVAFDPDGNPHHACLGLDGAVYYYPPGRDDWYRVDPGQLGAKSGVDLDISKDWMVIISYVNASNIVCTYHKPFNEGKWVWTSRGGQAK